MKTQKIIIASHGYSQSHFKVGSNQYAKEFVRMGHEVLLITFPVTPFHLVRIILRKPNYNESIRKFKSIFRRIYKTEEGYWEFVPFAIFPFHESLPYSLLNSKMNIINASIIARSQFSDADILMIENPKLNWVLKLIKYSILVYRATDIYLSMGKNSIKFQEVETQILGKANYIITTSYAVKSHLLKQYILTKKPLLIENGVDANLFKNKTKVINLKLNFKINLVYIGAIDLRINLAIVENMAENFPDYGFHFFGPLQIPVNRKFSNLIFHGPIEYKKISSILDCFDIALMPFLPIKSNFGRSPMKLYEYGMAGLPVITINTPHFVKKSKKEKFILTYSNENEFKLRIQQALNEQSSLRKYAILASEQNTWAKKAQMLLSSIT